MPIPAMLSANTHFTVHHLQHRKRQKCPTITNLIIICLTINQHRLIRRLPIRKVITEELDAEALGSFRP
jgi:hypothetical protein